MKGIVVMGEASVSVPSLPDQEGTVWEPASWERWCIISWEGGYVHLVVANPESQFLSLMGCGRASVWMSL